MKKDLLVGQTVFVMDFRVWDDELDSFDYGIVAATLVRYDQGRCDFRNGEQKVLVGPKTLWVSERNDDDVFATLEVAKRHLSSRLDRYRENLDAAVVRINSIQKEIDAL